MRKLISIVFSLLSISLIFTSCLKNDDEETTYSSECVITSYSLGTLNKYRTVTASDGSDSIVKDTVTGSNYKFTIDQRNLTIYNTDSLPVGTDISKVVAKISATGYAVTFTRNDSILTFSSTDSLDYTKQLQFTVHANDGLASKTYTVKLNVHQTYTDSLMWSKSTVSNFPASQLESMKSVYNNGKIIVLGIKNGALVMTEASSDNTDSWSALATANGISGTADINNIVTFGGKIYIVAGKQMYASENGKDWTAVEGSNNVSRLLATSSYEMFGVIDGNFASYSNGEWVVSGNTDIENLPETCVAFSSKKMKHNATMEKVVLTGINESNDSCGVVWNKVSAEQAYARQDWSYLPVEYINVYALPRLANLSVLSYNGELYAFGGAGKMRSTSIDALSGLYISGDEGITWKKQTKKTTLPEEIEGVTQDFTAVVDQKHNAILIIFKNGNIWRGFIPEIYIK
ncbi:MAG: hypothetical protein J5676_12125 [Bacteroidaceae bacterium]|nr:hypothetical protein [Bacteroidaceae bacterium]